MKLQTRRDALSPFVLLSEWVVLGLMAVGCAGNPHAQSSKNSVPSIASIAGIQIGCSTQEDLEKAWGPGLTVVGGHPNSGRVWRVRGTDWLVQTDGFDYTQRGLVVDQFNLSEGPGPAPHTPYTRPDKKAFAWLNGISPGMPKKEVLQILRQHSMTFSETGDDVRLQAGGLVALTSQVNYPLRNWSADLQFAHGRLSGLQLSADSGK